MQCCFRLPLGPGIVAAGGAFALAVAPASASAHIQLRAPLQRDSNLKQGPCGGSNGVRSANVCEFQPGATIVVAWDETVDHPGHFRISFDDDGEDDFVDPAGFDDLDSADSVLIDGIADRDTSGSDRGYTQELVLPDVECDNCTLQVIQVMSDKAPYGDGNDIYYQCADIVLSATAPADPANGCTAQSGGGGDGGAGDGADPGGGDGADESGGCSATGSGGGGAAAWLVPLLAAALTLRARRRR
jgi:hypothetical protein